MKKIARILLLTIAFTFLSCNDESQTDNTSQIQTKVLTSAQVNALKNQMNTIKNSTAWREMKALTTPFSQKMNGQVANVNTRAQFTAWINANIGLTNFASKAEAIQLFDNIVIKANVVLAQNQSFYAGIVNASPAQLPIIFEPIFSPAPTAPNNATPCQNMCMDSCDGCLDNAEEYLCNVQVVAEYLDGSSADGGGAVLGAGQAGYDTMIENCVGGLNACFAACGNN